MINDRRINMHNHRSKEKKRLSKKRKTTRLCVQEKKKSLRNSRQRSQKRITVKQKKKERKRERERENLTWRVDKYKKGAGENTKVKKTD